MGSLRDLLSDQSFFNKEYQESLRILKEAGFDISVSQSTFLRKCLLDCLREKVNRLIEQGEKGKLGAGGFSYLPELEAIARFLHYEHGVNTEEFPKANDEETLEYRRKLFSYLNRSKIAFSCYD